MSAPSIESTISEANIDTHEGRNIQLYMTKIKLKPNSYYDSTQKNNIPWNKLVRGVRFGQ